MPGNLSLLKVSSVVVKIAAWIFLLLGLVSGVTIMIGKVPANPWWLGVIVIVIYTFLFFLFSLVGRIPDLLIKLIKQTEK